MYTRHKEIPAFSAWPSQVDARCYGVVQRALKRHGQWIRFPLPDMARLELILQPNDWIVVDPSHGDIPIIAWSGFMPDYAQGIHQPVTCDLCYYHGAAGKVAAKVPSLLTVALRNQDGHGTGPDGNVIPFPRV